MRKLAGRLDGKKTTSTAGVNGTEEEVLEGEESEGREETDREGGDRKTPSSEVGSNPWHDVAPGPSQAVPSASYSRRLSFDQLVSIFLSPSFQNVSYLIIL